MTTIEPTIGTDPTPPGAEVRYEWSGFPWWFLGIIAVIVWPVVKILTDPNWREGFLFIKDGIILTFGVTLGGFAIAMVFGLIVSLGRMARNPFAKNIAIFYIELIRGIPVLVTIFIVVIVVKKAVVDATAITPQSFLGSNFLWATIAVGLIYAAFIAEVFRAGIESIPLGQREAGMAVGLSKVQVFRLIVWPQAIKNVLPALGNDLIALLKDSSLVSVMAVREITQMTRLWTGRSFQFIAGFMILAALYLVLTVSLSILLQWYERRIATP